MYSKELNEEQLKLEKGYRYFIDYSHPLKMGNSGKVYLHRHIASLKEGRWLTSEDQVHHKDENKLNNNPDNLEVLSRSQHARIHYSKNNIANPEKTRSFIKGTRRPLTCIVCSICGNLFKKRHVLQKYCSNKCRISSNIKLDSLSVEELEYLVWTESFTNLGKKFNCSDNGIKKWAIRLGCRLPPSRFHVKFITKEKKLEQYNRQVVEWNTRES